MHVLFGGDFVLVNIYVQLFHYITSVHLFLQVMMPLTAKTGATAEDRAKAVHTKLITPAYTRNKEEFLWYLGWCLTQLSTYGSTANTAAVATRVFAHALQATSNASQWKDILPVVKEKVSAEQWNEMVTDYYINEGGKQQ